MMQEVADLGLGLAFEIDPASLDTDPLANLYLPKKKLIGMATLGTGPRTVRGGFEAIDPAARARWQQLLDWRPKPLKRFADDLNAWAP